MSGKGSLADKIAWAERYKWKLQKEDELQAQADDYLYLFDGMPRVNAYLYMHDRKPEALGFCDYQDIYISERIFSYDDPWEVEYVIKHEMTHKWIGWKKIQMEDPHGQEFQNKLNEVLNA